MMAVGLYANWVIPVLLNREEKFAVVVVAAAGEVACIVVVAAAEDPDALEPYLAY